ncbi:hypothetical protein Gotur_006836, partial [Gossypium turneri]
MLLRYHPHSEDKIGCGLDSIMKDLLESILGIDAFMREVGHKTPKLP